MPLRYHANRSEFPTIKDAAQYRVASALGIIDPNLNGKTWMLVDRKTVVDAFYCPMTNWAYGFAKPTSAYPRIDRLIRRLAADLAVQAVHKSQGTRPIVEA